VPLASGAGQHPPEVEIGLFVFMLLDVRYWKGASRGWSLLTRAQNPAREKKALAWLAQMAGRVLQADQTTCGGRGLHHRQPTALPTPIFSTLVQEARLC